VSTGGGVGGGVGGGGGGGEAARPPSAKKTPFSLPSFFASLSVLAPPAAASAATEPSPASAAAAADDALAAAAALADAPAPPLRDELQRALAPGWREASRRAALAPVTDIVLVYAGEPVPRGFVKVERSVTGAFAGDLQAGLGGARQAWLALARAPSAPPITALAVVVLELGEFTPPGFQPVRHPASGRPANLRLGATPPSDVYLCFSRAPGAPIVDVGLAFPTGAARTPGLRALMPNAAAAAAAGDGGEAPPFRDASPAAQSRRAAPASPAPPRPLPPRARATRPPARSRLRCAGHSAVRLRRRRGRASRGAARKARQAV
jgi:hypothetical protein